MLELFKQMWAGWNRGIRGILWLQNTVLMTVAWVVAIAPVALVLKLMGRSMLDKAAADRAAPSYWNRRDPAPMDMGRAARRF